MDDTQPYRRPRQARARPARRSRQSRARSGWSWRRRAAIAAVCLLAVFVGAVTLVWQRAVAFNDAVSTESALSIRLFGPFSGGERANILLLGYSDESREGAFLSDSMNIISVDRATDSTTIIPIPRDLWVEGLAEVPQNMKINEAFRIGYYEAGVEYGAELASKAVTLVTGLPIHAWISLDFQGFEAMVNALDGVTIENPTAFAYTWEESKFLAGAFEHEFDAGTIHLTGTQALDYARSRYTSVPSESSDFARLVRQQRVLEAIRAEVTGWQTVPKGLAVADALAGHLHTNLPVLDLGMLVGKLQPDRRLELAEDEIVQATTNTLGQYVLVPIGQQSSSDYGALHEFIADRLAQPLPASSPSTSAPAG